MELALVVIVVAFALGFDYTNGFHDAANAIATSVSTRALTPRAALIMAAVFNLVGALLGTQVATTIAEDIISIGDVSPQEGLIIVLSGLVGAITWNLITWWLGLPSSSTHALIGGLTGAGIAAHVTVYWDAILDKVVIPMVLSPVVGFSLAFALMVGVLWLVRNSAPARTMRRFRVAQTASAAAMALGHGLQDAQKTMGVIMLALVAGGFYSQGDSIPLWVKLSAATRAAIGMVSTHAVPMFLATPQRTADRRLVAPTPMIAEVIVCVVEMGACSQYALAYRTDAATDSATKPRAGSSSMILRPRVRMMRQPPEYVPSEMAVAAESLTHSGMASPWS